MLAQLIRKILEQAIQSGMLDPAKNRGLGSWIAQQKGAPMNMGLPVMGTGNLNKPMPSPWRNMYNETASYMPTMIQNLPTVGSVQPSGVPVREGSPPVQPGGWSPGLANTVANMAKNYGAANVMGQQSPPAAQTLPASTGSLVQGEGGAGFTRGNPRAMGPERG